MKTFALIVIISVSSLVFISTSVAQTNGWTIVTTAQETLRSCTIGALTNGTVDLICGSATISMQVDSLRMLIRHNESHFFRDVGFGALIGTGAGVLIGMSTPDRSSWGIGGEGVAMLGGGILGAGVGGTIGAIVGVGSGGDDEYDLSRLSKEEKINTLRDARRKDL